MWEAVRGDGKRKLKWRAIPTKFPSRMNEQVRFHFFIYERAAEIAFVHTFLISWTIRMKSLMSSFQIPQNESDEEEEEDKKCEMPIITPKSLPVSQLTQASSDNEDMRALKKRLEKMEKERIEMNTKLELTDEIFRKNEQYRIRLRKSYRRLWKDNKNLRKQQNEYSERLKKLLNEDQLEALTRKSM